MKEEQDYIQDIAEIRSMMERSSKFLSLSGWAGVLAGVYALIGAWVAFSIFEFHPNELFYAYPDLINIILTATGVLFLALISALMDSRRKAQKQDKKAWNATSRRLVASMAVPLLIGGVLIMLLISNGLLGLVAPLTLLFYGFALYNAGSFTIKEVRIMGFVQMILGLLNVVFITYGLLFWAIGFGLVHIVYGIYMHFRYKR
jgi:MFS family permease